MVTNKEISEKAIEIVEKHERGNGAKDIRPAKKNSGYDIISIRPNGRRNIEVKGTTKDKPNEGFILNSQAEYDNLRKGGYIYRVTNIFNKSQKPKIYELTKEKLKLIKEPRWRLKIKNKRRLSLDGVGKI